MNYQNLEAALFSLFASKSFYTPAFRLAILVETSPFFEEKKLSSWNELVLSNCAKRGFAPSVRAFITKKEFEKTEIYIVLLCKETGILDQNQTTE